MVTGVTRLFWQSAREMFLYLIEKQRLMFSKITSRVKQRYQITTLPQGGTRSTHGGDGGRGGGNPTSFGLKICTLGIFWGQRSVMYILGLE